MAQPHVGRLRFFAYQKESVFGTFVMTTPVFVRYLPPLVMFPEATLLESAGIGNSKEQPVKADPGPATMNDRKLNFELEPSDNCNGILNAALGSDVVTGSALLGFLHTLKHLQASQLPSLSMQADAAADDKQLAMNAGQCGKMDFLFEKGEYVKINTSFSGFAFQDGLSALAPSVSSFSALKPLHWNQLSVEIPTGAVTDDLRSLHIMMDNGVETDHTLNDSTRYPTKGWSLRQNVKMTFEMLFTNKTEYDKFLAQSSTSMKVTLTSSEDIPGTSPALKFKYTWQMGEVRYNASAVELPEGVILAQFEGTAIPVVASPFLGRSLIVTALNDKATAY